jgi:hypothetical protein
VGMVHSVSIRNVAFFTLAMSCSLLSYLHVLNSHGFACDCTCDDVRKRIVVSHIGITYQYGLVVLIDTHDVRPTTSRFLDMLDNTPASRNQGLLWQ